MLAGILGGLIGALFGAVLIAGVLHVAFLLVGMTVPRFVSLWQAAFAAQAVVIVADGIGSALLPGTAGMVIMLAMGLAGAFLAYDRLLVDPDGAPVGRKGAALALGTHAVFSLAMFLLVYPVVISALI